MPQARIERHRQWRSVEHYQIVSGELSISAGYELVLDPLALVEAGQSRVSTAEMWTKTSLPPSSGTMKPYPRVGLNHFTNPVGIISLLSWKGPSYVPGPRRQKSTYITV